MAKRQVRWVKAGEDEWELMLKYPAFPESVEPMGSVSKLGTNNYSAISEQGDREEFRTLGAAKRWVLENAKLWWEYEN